MSHKMKLSDDLCPNPSFRLTLNSSVETFIRFLNLHLTIEANHRDLCRFSRGDKDAGAEFKSLQEKVFHIDKQKNTTNDCIKMLLGMNDESTDVEIREKVRQLITKRKELMKLKAETMEKARIVILEYKAVMELENKIVRDHEREAKRPREWKTIVREQWDQARYRDMYLKITGGNKGILIVQPFREIWTGKRDTEEATELVFQPDFEDRIYMDPTSFIYLYPDVVPYLNCLIRSRLASEHDDRVEFADIKPVPSTTALEQSVVYSHALVKQSRVKYEYFVGDDAMVTKAIGDNDIVFYERLETIDPSYLSRTHDQMAEVLHHEKKRMVTYCDRVFNYKPKAKTNFESIVRIYKTAHNAHA